MVANPEHVKILKQGVDVWNKWRKGFTNVPPDLKETNLSQISLKGFNFYEADLRWVDLSFSNLDKSELGMANINDSHFSVTSLKNARATSTNMMGSVFRMADLSEAVMTYADFREATISSCNLLGTDFLGAYFGQTVFAGLDLSCAVGLDSCQHSTPSFVSIDTIFRSKGKIPEAFLRGCGVPEDFINLIPSLVVAEPFQFYKCFISHSTKDHLFCDRLYDDLQSKGVRCWYFPEDARWGRPVWGEIDRPIKIYDKLILVCSKQSLNSPAVLRELERALQREDEEGKHILFPISIDNYLFDEWKHPRKADVISKVVGDFRDWRNPAIYREKLERLLHDLKASEE